MNPITITPHLGIGDLIVVKMIQLTNNMNISHININSPLIRTYSSDYNTKITFVNHLIHWLFPYATVSINDIEPDYFNFIVKYTYQQVPLYNHVNIPNKLTDDYSNALVFHTKFRYDRLIDQCQETIIPKLIELFKKYKTNRKIIIMGERNIGINRETNIQKPVSLYNDMLALRNNNDVTDMTQNILTEGTEFDMFLSDIEIINKCKCNIVFGIGGPCNIAAAFSKESIHVVPFLNTTSFRNDIIKLYTNRCETVEELEQKLQQYI